MKCHKGYCMNKANVERVIEDQRRYLDGTHEV